ncbi:MAG: serine/threonine protein phosphatase [Deltaproteobacteria bacterium]|nr:serine/threonine protein phosphatase [Deltaproteobacteria bacterium]
MSKTFAIGDIHGCHGSLLALLDNIQPDLSRDTLIFLGDYIDRGPDSKKVVSEIIRLMEEAPGRVIPLMGNHEQIFLATLAGEEHEFFLRMGGDSTLISYGIKPPFSGQLASFIPVSHFHFFRELLLFWEDRDYIYVHAGLQPQVHLSQQSPRWCCWARDQFLNSTYDFGKRVIFAHTPFSKPRLERNKIGIDTGAVYGGSLTCLVLPDLEFISVKGLPHP